MENLRLRLKLVKIAIIDCEYTAGVSVAPNPWLMKISSYYKQIDYDVFLVDDIINSSDYDFIFISKDTEFGSKPNPDILTDDNVYLLGHIFKRFKNQYKIPLQVHMARPDYNLYKFEFESELTRASYISVTYNGEIYKTQNQERTFRELPQTVIIDKDLWSSPNLGDALDIIAQYPKVQFLEPVDLNYLKTEELLQKFINLRLLNHTFTIKKVISEKELERVIFLLNKMKKIKNISVGTIEYISTLTVGSKENFKEVLSAIALANRNKYKIKILVPVGVPEYSGFIDYSQRQSYFDYLLKSEYRMEPIDSINHVDTQNNLYVRMIKTLSSDEIALKNGFTEWGGRLSPTIKLINKENVND